MNLPSASDLIRPRRDRWGWELNPLVGIGALGALLAVVVAGAGYVIAKHDGVDAAQGAAIQRGAFQTAFDQARADAAARAREDGKLRGQRAGRLAGERAGTLVGERRGSAAAKRAQAAAATRREARQREARQAEKAAVSIPVAETPAPTPAPEPAAPQSAAPKPKPPCFDASGRPC